MITCVSITNYKITFYSNKVQQEIMSLPKTLAAKYAGLTKLMLEFGSNLGLPYTQSMGGGLFELRLKGQEGIDRVLYCVLINKEIVMLHNFIKKTDKPPQKELEIAIKRMKEIKNG